MKIKVLFSLILLFVSAYSFSQNWENYLKEHKSQPVQKMYLQTDREFYFTGDTIWFAAYLVDGTSHVPIPGNSNLYVELINSKGEVSQNAIFTLFDGFSQGYLPVDGNRLEEGNYMLRSYNEYLRNFGDDYFFSKNLKIGQAKTITETTRLTESGSEQIEIDFYPEGGFLLAGQVNQLAFKVSGIKEENKSLSGMILDENGREIARFSTLYDGMGKLFFAPESNVTYTVKLDGFPAKEWKLPDVHTEGAKIVATLIDSAFVNLSILHSPSVDQDYHIAVFHRGQGLLSINVDAGNLDKMIRLTNNYFGEGINRVILLNRDFEPVSERLIFRDKAESIALKLDLNKKSFKTREEVVLHVHGSDQLEYDESAGLSVAVVNNNALNAKGITQNIKSYLLIDSELKGDVMDPADFFTDNEKVPANLKQDLLMLTQGWSNYTWNDLENRHVEADSTGFGLTFRGKLLDKKQKAISGSDVFLRLHSKTQSNLFFTSTDDQGNFIFQKVFFTDTAYYNIQGNNSKGRLVANVELEPLINSPKVNPDALNATKDFEDIPLSLYRLKMQNEQALKAFIPDEDSRVLQEIEVTGKETQKDDGHYRIYSNPSVSLEITKQDLAYRNIFDYLQGRVPGVQVTRGRVIIHGFSSLGGLSANANEPLYLLDGIAVDKSVASGLSMSAIDKIEVLKGNEAAMFGSRGSTGVISIFSKSNGNFGMSVEMLPTDVYDKIMGFAPYREFYSPRYSSEEPTSKKPDYRTTLYWNPGVQLFNGEAVLSFFTCDNLSDYTIFVEGITQYGRCCVGSTRFVVDTR